MTMTTRPHTTQIPGNVTAPSVLWFTTTELHPAKIMNYCACNLFLKLKNKYVILIHCWLKLNGKPKWNVFIANSAKTVDISTKEETYDPTDPKEPPKKVRRGFQGKKWAEKKVKQEGAAAKMTQRFVDILPKKEEYGKRPDIKDACKAEMFNMLIVPPRRNSSLPCSERKTFRSQLLQRRQRY
ncbi:Disease resistance protein RPM1 [Hordeum vulgare]|nr:Disease resistance protein RPM1 [Hordeum vulgare]